MGNVTIDQNETRHRDGPRHERRDVDAIGILLTAATLGLVIALSFGACWWLLAVAWPRTSESTLQTRAHRRLPPEPRLEQVNRMEAARSGISAESRTQPLYADQQLNSYGLVDHEARIVRIPIRDAIKIVAEEKLLPAVTDGSQEPREPKSSTERGIQK
jgi:hypothetical protein